MGGHQTPLGMERGGQVVISLQIISSLEKTTEGPSAWRGEQHGRKRKQQRPQKRGKHGGGQRTHEPAPPPSGALKQGKGQEP